jgi:hypothetical protein
MMQPSLLRWLIFPCQLGIFVALGAALNSALGARWNDLLAWCVTGFALLVLSEIMKALVRIEARLAATEVPVSPQQTPSVPHAAPVIDSSIGDSPSETAARPRSAGTINTLRARAVQDVTVRAGAGDEHLATASLRANESVVLIGRSADGLWLHLRGGAYWVRAADLDVSGSTHELPITS